MKSLFLLLLLTIPLFVYPQADKKITIGVLYFENNSLLDKEKLNGLSKGLADMLITELTKIKAFRVVERERLNDVLDEIKLSQSGAVDPGTAQKVGKLLGAQTLLLGSFINSFGNQMRVDLRIVETETGLTLKAEEVTDDADEIFDIVKELAERVTDEMDIKLSAEESSELERGKFNVSLESSIYYSQAVDLEDAARSEYMKGNKEGSLSNYQKAAELYQLALKNGGAGKISKISGLIDEIKVPEINYQRTNPPSITVLEPKNADNEIIHRENIIAVKIKAEDLYGLTEVLLNGNKMENLSGGDYAANVNLNKGINTITITATNSKNVAGTKEIKVFVPEQIPGTQIAITEPAVTRGIKLISKKEILNVRGRVLDEKGIASITVNGRDAVVYPDGGFSIQMPLAVGENKLLVKAVNRVNDIKVDTFTIVRNAEEVISSGKYYALVIGINSYSGFWPPLRNAVNDAKEFAETIQNQYKIDEVISLYDKDATRTAIIEKLEYLANNLSKEDNLIIFYSGHGQLNKILNKGYWVPVDASTNSVAGYISNNDIKTFLGGIQSKHTLLIADACFAGDIFRGGQTEQVQFDPNNMEKYYKEVYRKQSRLALTSGGIEQVADGGKENHSIFTYYLLKALKENNKKYLDAAQLFNEFRVSVTNNSEQTPQLQSVKDTNDEGGQFIFVKKI